MDNSQSTERLPPFELSRPGERRAGPLRREPSDAVPNDLFDPPLSLIESRLASGGTKLGF